MSKWIRPVDTSDTSEGINDTGIHHFRETKYESLAREILQNSLDEQYNRNKSVKVEFSTFIMKTIELPGFQEYKQMFKDTSDFWGDDTQQNAQEFLVNALKELEKDEITILRISDFNTNGITGAHKKNIEKANDMTPWHNLVKSEGSSSKAGIQGGSFGIGKNATFANSIFRTVFYSTYSRNEEKAYEGVAKLATHKSNGKKRRAKAFFGKEYNGNSIAVDSLLDIQKDYNRTEYGSDIYIIGFEIDENWKIRMIKTVLSDFIVPIYQGDLEVNINNTIINSNNLEMLFLELIDKYDKYGTTQIKNELETAFSYYKVLNSEDTEKFNFDVTDLGEVVLKVLYNPDFERKVMRVRETGMCLFTEGNISSTIGFVGIASLKGKKLNKLFRKMENPSHTSWSVDNLNNSSDKKRCKVILKDINKWIRETIINNAIDQELEEIDFVGLSEYLPASLINDKKDKDKSDEKISTEVSNIDVIKKNREKVKEAMKKTKKSNRGGEEDEEGSIGFGNSFELGKQGKTSEGNNKSEGRFGDDNQPMYLKLDNNDYNLRLHRDDYRYGLIIKSTNDIHKGMIKIMISGETTNEKISVKNAFFKDDNLECDVVENKIYFNELISNKKNTIYFEVEDDQDYAMEVKMYASKS